jgi:hypothetical protein
MVVMNANDPKPSVWPDAMALGCPSCDRTVRLKGVRSDLRLEFLCPAHGWFKADSWTSATVDTDPCASVVTWTTPVLAQGPFLACALEVLIRAGVEGDHLYFHAPDPDHSVEFTLVPGGDGAVLAEVGARFWVCSGCALPPPGKPNEAVLFELGFAPANLVLNYECEQFPADPVRLAEICERIFREALAEPADFGLCAEFDDPDLADAFYLMWSACEHAEPTRNRQDPSS